ncbi:MAG: hypothetical protein SXU28_12145 [Pseudomonadota bacterium]|nr:hypothetical protein [Pseudomonadota bacterium]
MKFFKPLGSLCALAFAFSSPAQGQGQGQERSEAELSAEDRAAVEGALNRGLLLRRYDQAAWHATDALREDVKDLGASGIRGWIVNDLEQGLEVVFYRPVADRFEAVWSGIYSEGEVKSRTVHDASQRYLTEAEAALARAGRIPAKEEIQRCSNQPFNTVVMPTGKGDGSLYVYYLVPQASMDSLPLGGHYRFELRDDKIVGRRKFTNSCFAFDLGGKKGKGRPAAVTISHLLDPVPTEIHVFSTYAAQLPIYVMTTQNELIWASEISGGQPRLRIVKR